MPSPTISKKQRSASGNGQRGPLKDADKEFIQMNKSHMTIEAMAEHINRRPIAVKKFVEENAALFDIVHNPDNKAIRAELLGSHAWKNLKEEFDNQELKYFEEQYISLMAQFKNDVLASEEIQIFHAVKYEILMSRNLKQRKKINEDVARTEKKQQEFVRKIKRKGSPSEAEQQLLLDYENQIINLKAAERGYTQEYAKLEERHSKLMMDLKGTRDQRIKQIESDKVSFLGLIKMLEQRDLQKEEGRKMGLVKLALKKEQDRLAEGLVYADGTIDRPILSADTVDNDEEE